MICDNGMYGTIRMHQEREFPGRVAATELHNPDFDAYARAFGGFGAVVNKTSDFPAAFQAARELGLPSIIHLKIDFGGDPAGGHPVGHSRTRAAAGVARISWPLRPSLRA